MGDTEEFRRCGFENVFRKAKSPRIMYEGREIWSDHQFPIADGQRLRLIVQSFDTNWGNLGKGRTLQGVGLTIDKKIEVCGMSCSLLTIWPYPPPVSRLRLPAEKLLRVEFGSVHAEAGIGSRLYLWLDQPSRPVDLIGHTRDGHIHIWNAWQFEKATAAAGIHSGHYGAGMLVEEITDGFCYRCNDGYPDQDFDDIVFTIERL
jgi:hypothetical protein